MAGRFYIGEIDFFFDNLVLVKAKSGKCAHISAQDGGLAGPE